MYLYDISTEYRDLAEKILEQDGEITEEDMKQFDTLEYNFLQKADNYAGLIKEVEAEIGCLDEAIKRQEERKKKRERLVEKLKGRLAQAMDIMGKDKVDTLNACVTFRRSLKVEIVDEKEIPEEFFKAVYTANKSAIRDALKAGHAVPGAELKENRSIQIR